MCSMDNNYIPKFNQLTVLGFDKTTKYYLVDCHRYVIIRCNRNEFKTRVGPVITNNKGALIRLINLSERKHLNSRLRNVISELRAESLYSVISDTSLVFRKVFSISSKILGADSSVIQPLFLDITSLMLQHSTSTFNNWTPSYFLGFLARIASIYLRTKHFVAESLDVLLLVLGGVGLPDRVLNIFKRMNVLTSKKIGDNPNVVLDILSGISEFFHHLIEKSSWVPQFLKNYLCKLFILGKKQSFIYRMKSQLLNWDKDRKVMLDVGFRDEVRMLNQEMSVDEVFLDYVRTSPYVHIVYKRYEKLVKSLQSYESCSRVEPVCIVLEGPPGVKKTICAIKLVQLLGRSTYTHVVKPTEDGKDFYDGYNNEEVFVMDDVGQQGVSQWRMIINMVSNMKLPLDCASVDLKDTKYFDSKILVLTTNNLSNLSGLTKSDGITDIEALWRRCHIFRFNNEKDITYLHYDVYRSRFINGFPKNFNSINLKPNISGDHMTTVPWMTTIVKRLESLMNEYYSNHQLTPSQIDVMNERMDEYDFVEAESWTVDTFCVGIGSLIRDYYDYVSDMLENIVEKVVDNGSYVALAIGLTYAGVMIAKDYFRHHSKNENKEVITQEWRKAIAKSKVGSPAIFKGNVCYIAEDDSALCEVVKKQLYIFEFYKNEGGNPIYCHGYVSSHNVLLPLHVVDSVVQKCSVYLNDVEMERGNVMLDKVPFEKIFSDRMSDIAVVRFERMSVLPFKNFGYYFKPVIKDVYKDLNLVTSVGSVKLAHSVGKLEGAVKYTSAIGEHVVDNPLTYGITSPGLCGSLVVDGKYGIVGMHVAGNGDMGVSVIFSQQLLGKLNYLMSKTEGFHIENEIRENKKHVNFSGMRLHSEHTREPPKKSKLAPTNFYDFTAKTKAPVNMTAFKEVESGKNVTLEMRTVKNFKRDFSLTTYQERMLIKLFESLIPYYSPIGMKVVIKGDDRLPGMNKDSVSGLAFPAEKADYLDFSSGTMYPEFEEIYNSFYENIMNDKVELEHVLQYFTLKDELRPVDKVNRPRAFGVDTILNQIEMKRLLGEVLINIQRRKWDTGIMIGINPYYDFDRLWKEISVTIRAWDFDFGEYDSCIMGAIQRLLNRVLLERFQGSENDKKMLEFQLNMVVSSFILVKDRIFMKTHGVLSGRWETNLFDSIYNKAYSFLYYLDACEKQKHKPSVENYFAVLKDFVQGDDKLCGVTSDAPYMDAVSMANYLTGLGMTVTTGNKGNVTEKDVPKHELTFLKRKFSRHNQIGRVMGLLSKETLDNMLGFYDTSKDYVECISGKLSVYQREYYLYEHEYKQQMTKLKEYCKGKRLPMEFLDEDYILDLYQNYPEFTYNLTRKELDKIY